MDKFVLGLGHRRVADARRYAALGPKGNVMRVSWERLRWSLGVVCFGVLSGCYPGLPLVQPKSNFTVVDSDGGTVENAKVTVATYRWPFPRPTTTVLTTFRTNEDGELNLRANRKWQWQLLLPDAGTWYTWSYCVEKPGFRAVASPELQKRIGQVTVALQAANVPSTCAWPDDDEQQYSQVRIQE